MGLLLSAGSMARSSETSLFDLLERDSGPTIEPAASPPQLLVLCYHRFSSEPSNELELSPEVFEAHLSALREARYEILPMSAAIDGLRGRTTLPPRAAVLTIDDGHPSGWTVAAPILRRHKARATYYVYPAQIAEADRSGRKSRLTWADLRNLAQEGHEIECHSMTHALLTRPAPPAGADGREAWLRDEIEEAKRLIENRVGRPVRTFAYPYGGWNPEIRRRVLEAGYEAAVSATDGVVGPDPDLFTLPRIVIVNRHTPRLFARLLTWMPLGLSSLSPGDGGEVAARSAEISAQLADAHTVDPETVRMRVSKTQGRASYDAASGRVVFRPVRRLRPGLHFVTAHARDRETRRWRVRVWQFEVVRDGDRGAQASPPREEGF